jgi:hypothetical protein
MTPACAYYLFSFSCDALFSLSIHVHLPHRTVLSHAQPIHFHLLGECPDCYFKDSSVHKSFYRCISIHGTHQMTASENVAYDVVGYCYYLEDGIEQDNTISFNLGAHIHLLGPEAPWGYGQTTELYQQSNSLTLPADVTASAFYITNIHNHVIGNSASGGWSGFAFPNLPEPLGPSRGTVNMRPSAALPLTLDGNTAHSTAWWWYHAGMYVTVCVCIYLYMNACMHPFVHL